jgi:long-chain acyl-CoA synthetase
MLETVAQLFYDRALKRANATCVRYKVGKGPYRDMNWLDYSRMVKEIAAGLSELNLKKGDCAAILSQSSHLWVAADLAILTNNAISVPIYPTGSVSDLEFILQNSQAAILFVQNESLLNKVLSIKGKLEFLKKIVLLTPPSGGKSICDLGIEDNLVMGLEELQELGRTKISNQENFIEDKLKEGVRKELATIIYTSGTTGVPKGVMLTHDNILSCLDDLPEAIPLRETEIYLSYLPLSHVFERVCGEFYWIHSGGVCAFAEGLEHMPKNMAETKPSMLIVVPRVLEKVYSKVKSGIDGAKGTSKILIEWAISVGKDFHATTSNGKEPSGFLNLKHRLADKLVLSKLREKINGNLRMIISGGAPANKEVIQFFNAVGITTMEGYGLTETTAPISVHRANQIKAGTVGPKINSIEVKIAEDGEILVKGPTVFTGYYKAEDATKEVFSDGWFHTGDIGVIDSTGHLKITDRKKDLIVNSSGKNIAPQHIESLLKTIPIVTQVVLFGDKRKSLVALITLDEQPTMELAREKGWSFTSFEDLSENTNLKQYIKAEINKLSGELADYERVRNFTILQQDLSVDGGELTATLKVKRNVVRDKYKSTIEAMYKEEEAPTLVGSGR